MDNDSHIQIVSSQDGEPRFTKSGIRDFRPHELGDFVYALYQKLLPIPTAKVHLSTVGQLIQKFDGRGLGEKELLDISYHVQPDCGSTFCVLGWALTDQKLRHELGAHTYIADMGQFEGFRFLSKTKTDVDLIYCFALAVEDEMGISEFLFNPAQLHYYYGGGLEEKFEALLRCACVYAAMKSDTWHIRSSVQHTPFLEDCGVLEAYRYMHERGYLDTALQMMERDGVNVADFKKWQERQVAQNWASYDVVDEVQDEDA